MRPVSGARRGPSRRFRASNSARPICQNRGSALLPERLTMHVEPLEKLPRSVREFLSHYSMIVLSILTALALEQGLVRLEHHHEAERARLEIEQEIDGNRRQVENSLAETHRYLA